MKLPSNGQLNGMMNGNGKKRIVAVNKRVGILKPSTSCPNLTANDLNRNGSCNLTNIDSKSLNPSEIYLFRTLFVEIVPLE